MLGLRERENDMLSKEDLKKYSREDLESIVLGTAKIIDKFNIIPQNGGLDFSFEIDGKCYDAQVLVDMWNIANDKSIREICNCCGSV